MTNLHATAHPPPSASATHALERHRDVLAEYRRDFQRTQASGSSLERILPDTHAPVHLQQTSLRDAEQRANLLGSVREEIRSVYPRTLAPDISNLTAGSSMHSAFKTATGASVTDSLLAERGRIDNSHRMADDTLECVPGAAQAPLSLD